MVFVIAIVASSLSRVRFPATPWTARLPCPSPSPKSAQTHVHESMMPSNHLILCCSILLLPSIFPSNRVFSNKSAFCIRWPKYWSFSFRISLSNEYPRFISFLKVFVREIKIEVFLFRLQKQESRLWLTSEPAWIMCLPESTSTFTSKSSGALVKKGRGSWDFLSPWRPGQAPRVYGILWCTK